MQIKISIWEKLPEEQQNTKLWFLFENVDFYELEYVQNFILSINCLQTFQQTESRIFENIVIFEESRTENNTTKIRPYILIGAGLREARVYEDKTEIRYELSNTVEYLPTDEVFELMTFWLKALSCLGRQGG